MERRAKQNVDGVEESLNFIARGIDRGFLSLVELAADDNHAANVVDGLFDIARAIRSLASAVQELADKH